MYPTINRHALILFPAKALTDWVNKVFPDNPVHEITLMGHDEANVYLIPEFDDNDQALVWLKKNYRNFFEEELFNWCTDEEQWPKKLSWEMFQQWFNFSIQSMVLDAEDGDLEKEDF